MTALIAIDEKLGNQCSLNKSLALKQGSGRVTKKALALQVITDRNLIMTQRVLAQCGCALLTYSVQSQQRLSLIIIVSTILTIGEQLKTISAIK